MTSGTLDRSAQATHRRPQWLRVAGWQLQVNLFLMAWAWTIAIIVVVVVLSILSRSIDVESSSFAFSHHGLLWFPFSIAILLTTTYLPLHVANGMTRRSFIKAAILSNVAVGLLNAVLSTAALLVERAVYERLGWFHGDPDRSGAELFSGGVLTYGVGLALLFVAGMLSGLLVGVAYYRLGGWWGTLALPLTVSPIIATSLLALSTARQWTPWGVGFAPDWPVNVLVGLTVLAAAAAGFALLTRRVPIDTRKA